MKKVILISIIIISKISASELPKTGLDLLKKEPASLEYQILGQEAQRVLGASNNTMLPILKFGKFDSTKAFKLATTNSDAIVINEEEFDKMPYGAKRCTLMHESVHAKYNDSKKMWGSALLGFVVGGVGSYHFLSKYKKLFFPKTSGFAIGFYAAYKSLVFYSRFMEQRADREGHYASACSKCVHEAAQHCQKQTFDNAVKLYGEERLEEALAVLEKNRQVSGYLSIQELSKIAKDLGDKVCDYHTREQGNS